MGDFAYKQIRYRQTHRDDKKKKSPYGGGIPDRWLDYNGVHQPIPGTRFVAFKCPLKPELQKNLPADMRFTLGDLVEKLDDQGQELGLIIDLTNTERYYKPIDIADARIKYHKMMTPGHHNIPSEECYQQFAGVVKSFLEQNQDNEKLIGVHCTHGLNRTGYLITRYIIEYLNKSPQDAIDAFNTARGHQMEKYCEDLKLRTAITANGNTASVKTITTDVQPLPNVTQWPSLFSTEKVIDGNNSEQKSTRYEREYKHNNNEHHRHQQNDCNSDNYSYSSNYNSQRSDIQQPTSSNTQLYSDPSIQAPLPLRFPNNNSSYYSSRRS